MQPGVVGRLLVQAPVEAGGDVGELRMQVFPFAHALRGQELTLTPAPERRAGQRRAFSLVGAPQIQQGDEIRALVRPCRMPLVRRLLRIRGALARILQRQHSGERQHLGERAAAGRRHQHPRDARIHGQPRHLPTDGRDAAFLVDRLEFLQQPVAVVDEARVRRVEERKIRAVTEAEDRHLQDDACQVRAQHLRRRLLGAIDEVLLRVQAQAQAVANPSAAAASLVGAGLRDGFHRQALDLGAR